jgi:hypothetical protein
MDLRLFWAVAKRYKRISIGGTLLAAVVAIFAYGTPGPHGITPRGSVTWESRAQLIITQSGGAAYGQLDSKHDSVGATGYFSALSPIYSGLANGNAVQSAILSSKIPGRVVATEGIDPNTGAYIPFVNLTADAPSAADAVALSQRAIGALQHYIDQIETSSGVPSASRITLGVVQNGLPPVIASKPKPTIPALIFLAILAGTIMLIFSLENRDPQTAAALGRVPATPLRQTSPNAGMSAVVPPRPSYRRAAGHDDHAGDGSIYSADPPAALDRLLKRG